MTPERWQQIDRMLQEAMEREPAERPAFLAAACADDDELRREVESLLDFHRRAETFIEAPPAEVAADWLGAKESRAGQTIGPYRLIRLLGRGGMGDVYLARDGRLGRQVALKLLPPRFTADTRRVQRFRQEARAASALNHPNIITIYEIGEAAIESFNEADLGKTEATPQTPRLHFIATEFIEGHTLRELIRSGGMKPSESLEAAAQIASALSAAHAVGITHRDIKPENIMLRPDGYVKVLDFGLAKLSERLPIAPDNADAADDIDSDEVKTESGVVLGTASYMSPEQARGLKTDGRSDIFSLGLVLYEMLTAHRPFEAETVADSTALMLGQEPPPLSQYSPELPADLQDIVTRALAKDRAERFQTADELRRALKKLQRQIAPHEDFSTHEFSGQSLLARRVGEARESQNYEIATNTAQARARITSGIPRPHWFLGSPMRIVLAVLALAATIAAVVLGRQWYSRQSGRVDSIAVLPFKPLSADSRDQALEMGVAETLVMRLGNLKRITVSPITAVRRYTRLDQDAVAAGRELGVRAVLEGSVQRAGDKIRVTARLINVVNNKPIWSGQFDEPWTDILAVEDAIARHVADGLLKTLNPGERGQLARNYTADPEAYRLYLSGSYLWNRRSPESLRQSITYFQQAVERDPAYALAYVGLADALVTLNSYHLTPPRSVMPQARAAAAQALKIDDNLAEAHAVMGKISNDYYWDWTEAEREFQRAIELKPNDPTTHHWRSSLFSNLGRFDEAISEARRAVELDPLSPLTNTQAGVSLYWARRYDEAVAVLRKTLEREPTFLTAHIYLGLCQLMRGRHEEGLEEFRQARQAAPNYPDLIGLLGYGCGLAGKRDEARRYERELDKLAEHTYVSPFNYAGIHSGLGETDATFKWLERCYDERESFIGGLQTDPLYDTVRRDPRFADLARRIGVAQ